MRLLTPTPGSRTLLKTLTKSDSEKLEMLATTTKKERIKVESKSAANLISDHKKKLERKALIEKQSKEAPSLGRGFGSGL